MVCQRLTPLVNTYEYLGFSTDILEGQKRLPEAEDLLIKAWTTEALEYHGEYWQVTVPAVRPRPASRVT